MTANRYEAGASAGYKLDERSYIVGAARYEHDSFSPFTYQAVVSIGYGYTVLKNEATSLSFEIGPGYKQYNPRACTITTSTPPVPVTIDHGSQDEVVGRGLMTSCTS